MRCIELFAGAGGAAIGLERAGFQHAALCEWDRDACATLRAAGLGPVVEGDVRDLDAIAAVSGEHCDVLWSSFPCQAFSSAGKRKGASDERNGWPWTVAAIDRFRPTWFLGENVRGLLQHVAGCIFIGRHGPDQCSGCYFEQSILSELRKRFSYVGFWLLDAADFGVPQHRLRVFLWAGPQPLHRPETTHGEGKLPHVSVGDAIGVCGSVQAGIARTDSGTRGSPRLTTKPAPTISCTSRHYLDGERKLTPRECATLQGFPRNYPFQGSALSQYRQIGNAVPPILAFVVGSAIQTALSGA